MKVVLYAVRAARGQKALISIDWETDRKYWNDRASEIVRLREEIPLGEGERMCRMLEEEWASETRSPAGKGLKEESGDRERAWRGAEEKQFVHGGWAERLVYHARSAGYAGEMERIKLREGAAAEPRLLEAAGRAAARLAGRSLLREEAQQLLDAELPGSSGVSAFAALQLAALLGAVQLTAAVAPDAVAAPASAGLRGWAERALRRARLLRGRGAGGRAQVLRCRRCGSADKLRRTDCAACGRQACAYCEACLTMGRSRECELLVIGLPTAGAALSVPVPAEAPLLPTRRQTATAPFPTSIPTASPAPVIRTASVPSHSKNIRQHLIKRWGLSPAQSDAAAQALAFLEAPRASKGRSFLLWAVTGAGKTEMIFPLLDSVLSRGGRALVATPRRDVVLELAPRLAKAFPDRNIAVLYGGSPDRWREGELTLATTHQLLRFQGAFDLVLIDELDAFPYHNDPMLHYAAAKCGKPDGRTVYLSATPPAALQREASRGRLAYARVPVRYHRYPLPVPARLKLPSVYQVLAKQTIPQRLLQPIRRSVDRGAQVFLFVPYVKQVEPMVRLLRNQAKNLGLPGNAIAGTSSPDEERGEKVVAFRDRTIQLLVTTTILERGVTIPRSDVFILDAHNSLFDAASLVQMAGRAGRSGDDPFGVVYYGAPEWTRSQRNSIRQIRTMNAAARRKGYLKAD
ncbi:late competence protein required for DNA uptake (superfamily II DNA/RNA helicase) [Cohnella sp. SGD-V74]|uniref:DEAD/DEAH box helicase n=1 Tax=unclassified Cohnella TaxID=2636738 RepID=UPI000D4B8335|nr:MULTISPECIES: helicase-related protein [unclassified Cohnella]PRX67107.1 late competence protein required for DNA uptake (superfamily II DNA/RNA helicase) [Cohnella sp. SGD-V74]